MNHVSGTEVEEIAKPEKATRTRATYQTATRRSSPASPIAADESPSPTQALSRSKSTCSTPASKPSPKGAQRVGHISVPVDDAPVAKVPARAGRKASLMTRTTHASPSATLSPQGEAAGQTMSAAQRGTASGKIPAQAGERANIDGPPTCAPPAPSFPASAGADETNSRAKPDRRSSRQQSSSREGGEIGHALSVTHPVRADFDPSASDGGDAGHFLIDTQWMHAGVEQIVQLWRMRQRWHRAEKSLTLQGKALCRSWTNGDKAKASELFDTAADGGNVPPEITIALMPFLSSIERFQPERAKIERELQKLSKSLPIWAWVANQKGFGSLNLAAIVGEAGDVGSYRNPSCLWKRMGMAVIGGIRQRKMSNAEDALAHGYNPSRRAVAYLLGDCLIKGNGEGRYRTLYLARKEIEAARDEVKTKAHAHNRAARYMTKRVLRDLWGEWRRCGLSEPQQ